MLKKFAVSTLLATVAMLVSHAQMHDGARVPVPARISVPPDGLTVPMQDMGGRPVVELKINGKGPYRFILDTGAMTTVIADDLSRELSLSPPQGLHVASPDGRTPPAIVLVDNLRISDVTLEGMIVAVMPLGGLLNEENAPRGILSAASFPGYLLIYDYLGRRISIRKGSIDGADFKTSFQYAEDQVLPTVPIRIAGHETQVHLDTGSGFGLTLPVKFLKEVPLASQPKEAGKARTHAGEFPVSIARIDGAIELGAYKLDLNEVRFSDVRPGPGPAVGNIGYDVLRHFVVTLDSKNRRIRFDQ